MVKFGIYKITSPSNKVYIGKTLDITRRKNFYKNLHCNKQPKIYNSLKKYGWEQHKFEIIEECNKDLLILREIYYKQQFINEHGWKNALFCNILDGEGRELSEITKLKISKAKKGHKCFNDNWRNKISKSLLKLKRKCTEQSKQARSEKMKGRINKFSESHVNNIKISRRKTSKRVIQYDLNGNFVKEWESKGQAAEYIKKEYEVNSNVTSQIKDCILGRQKTAYNYVWEYKDEPKVINFTKIIYQFDLNKNLINKFKSLKELKEWLIKNRPQVSINTIASTIKKKSHKSIYKSGKNYYSILNKI